MNLRTKLIWKARLIKLKWFLSKPLCWLGIHKWVCYSENAPFTFESAKLSYDGNDYELNFKEKCVRCGKWREQ